MQRSKESKISVIILTMNEEDNIKYALSSIGNWTDDIHIIDSGSTDRTLSIAEHFNVNIHKNNWTNWAEQRNWALNNISIKYDWILFLDADEQITIESTKEIEKQTANAPDSCVAFKLAFNYYFLGKYVRNAMLPHLRLIRKGKVKWLPFGAKEKTTAPIDSQTIKAKLIHYDHKPLNCWIKKQLRNAEIEAKYRYSCRNGKQKCFEQAANTNKNIVSKIKFIINTKTPIMLTPLVFFLCRFVLNLSFRNFLISFFYVFLLGFCYPIAVNINYVKICLANNKN